MIITWNCTSENYKTAEGFKGTKGKEEQTMLMFHIKKG